MVQAYGITQYASSLSKTLESEKNQILPKQNVQGRILPPVHEDFNSFLVSSASQTQIVGSAKIAVTLQNHKFIPETEKDNVTALKEPPITPKTESKPSLTKVSLIPLINMPMQNAQLQNLQSFKVHTVIDKGYGIRTTTDPLIAMVTTDLNKFSIGLVSSVQSNSSDSGHDFDHESDSSKPHTKSLAKNQNISRNVTLLKREEIEAIRDVKEKFQQQLNAKYPHISVPIKHPEGMVNIHLRFDRKDSVRVLFSGSSSQVVSLLAQHREDLIKSITDHGYTVDPSQVKFNHMKEA